MLKGYSYKLHLHLSHSTYHTGIRFAQHLEWTARLGQNSPHHQNHLHSNIIDFKEITRIQNITHFHL